MTEPRAIPGGCAVRRSPAVGVVAVGTARGKSNHIAIPGGFTGILNPMGLTTATDEPRPPAGFAVKNVIHEGALSVVYDAERDDGTRVSLKVWRRELRSPQEEALFQNEVLVLRVLSPRPRNVVKLSDASRKDAPTPWIATHLHGHSAEALMRHRGGLGEEGAVLLVRDLLEGLAYCHQQHVVHGDVKLANLLVDDHGRGALCDFGSSVWNREPVLRGVVGTPGYMAPEIDPDGPGGMPDERSDVFAAAKTAAKLLRHVALPLDARDLVHSLAQDVNPAGRPANATEFLSRYVESMLESERFGDLFLGTRRPLDRPLPIPAVGDSAVPPLHRPTQPWDEGRPAPLGSFEIRHRRSSLGCALVILGCLAVGLPVSVSLLRPDSAMRVDSAPPTETSSSSGAMSSRTTSSSTSYTSPPSSQAPTAIATTRPRPAQIPPSQPGRPPAATRNSAQPVPSTPKPSPAKPSAPKPSAPRPKPTVPPSVLPAATHHIVAKQVCGDTSIWTRWYYGFDQGSRVWQLISFAVDNGSPGVGNTVYFSMTVGGRPLDLNGSGSGNDLVTAAENKTKGKVYAAAVSTAADVTPAVHVAAVRKDTGKVYCRVTR